MSYATNAILALLLLLYFAGVPAGLKPGYRTLLLIGLAVLVGFLGRL